MLGIFAEGSIVAPRVIIPAIRSADDTADDSDNLLNSKYVTKSMVKQLRLMARNIQLMIRTVFELGTVLVRQLK